MADVGALIASGRDADIYEFGVGRVLRRSRVVGRSQADEARIMEYVRDQGYPVPQVFDVSDDGTDLVMERVEGPTMAAQGGQRPWSIRSLGKQLAELHVELHKLPAPQWLKPAGIGSGDRVLHMDLHPLNVLETTRGPVVIDWTNAVSGDPSVDVALTWVLVASGELPTRGLQGAIVKFGRNVLLNAFLSPLKSQLVVDVVSDVVEWKAHDAHMSSTEIARMRALGASLTHQ
jgi:aminoglycoside phosphotransferase (APT) family kinase protein